MSDQAEKDRLDRDRRGVEKWRRWGAYLSERQWGTVREDYSADGSAWDYFPHDQARSRAYRWGEDGIAGICDDQQRLCFSLALWNGRDPILKERLFGLTGSEGNHGEDVKELYYYLDATPTHSYLKMLYKYPQAEYPVCVAGGGESPARQSIEPEFELIDTGVFDGRSLLRCVRRVRQGRAGRHPDPDHRCTIAGRTRRRCMCCRSCGFAIPGRGNRDARSQGSQSCSGRRSLRSMRRLGQYSAVCRRIAPQWLFCDNETNAAKLFGTPPIARVLSRMRFTSISCAGKHEAVNPQRAGTKAAAHYAIEVPREFTAARFGCGW